MFTGLVEETGTLTQMIETPDGLDLIITAEQVMDDLKVDDSISVSGVCLTVVARDAASFTVNAVPETIARTTMRDWRVGTVVNLERALLPTTRLGGHIVQGHVDGTTEVRAIKPFDKASEWTFGTPPELARYIVTKGSIAIEGISLTVARAEAAQFTVAIIPHTTAITNFAHLEAGAAVNLEVDIVAKYVENLMGARDGL